MDQKYKPVDGAKPQDNLIVGLYCIANELATLNDHIEAGVVTYHPK